MFSLPKQVNIIFRAIYLRRILAILLLIGLGCFSTLQAQLTTQTGFTAQQLAENLAGSNVTVFNATITSQSNTQFGTFT